MKSKFVQHLENQHHIDSVDNIMDILHITNKGKVMDTIEKFYIYGETKLNNQINDKITVKPNVIFENLVRQDPHRGIPAARNSQSTTQPQFRKSHDHVHTQKQGPSKCNSG